MSKFFIKKTEKKPRAAIFLSGNGSDTEKILSDFTEHKEQRHWIPAVLVTDRPKTSRAAEIAGKYGLPLVEHGIAAFYRSHGLSVRLVRAL